MLNFRAKGVIIIRNPFNFNKLYKRLLYYFFRLWFVWKIMSCPLFYNFAINDMAYDHRSPCYFFPVAGIPMYSAWGVPVCVLGHATILPSATIGLIVTCRSGNAVLNVVTNFLITCVPLSGEGWFLSNLVKEMTFNNLTRWLKKCWRFHTEMSIIIKNNI